MHSSTVIISVQGLVALICGLILIAPSRQRPIVVPMGILVLAVGVSILVTAIIKEINLAHRDAAIQARLAPAGIETIGAGWGNDSLMVVRTKGCTATFQVKEGANPGAWPLVLDTGHTDANSGCGSKDLDKIFAPR